METKDPCKHEDFWFDRTISYCRYCEDEHMDSVCNECSRTSCDIQHNGIANSPPTDTQTARIQAADELAKVALEWHRTKPLNERHMACSQENPCDLWQALQRYRAFLG